jgi:hypothetical protein
MAAALIGAAAFCVPSSSSMTPLPGGFPFDYRLLATIKAALALSALALLLWDLNYGPRATERWVRVRNGALAGLGTLSLAAWWNFGALHGPGQPLHLHDFFHYYVGSKYYAELGYTRIYQCTAVAEMQRGRSAQVVERWTRNLDTNNLEHILPDRADVDECLTRFGPERWRDFTSDVEWFRSHMRADGWRGVPMVFGHNATPVWNAMGNWLTRSGPASDRQILLLGSLDTILLAIMWLIVWRTFGWQAGCVAAIWWGLNEATGYYWVGGGFLRQDVLFCIVGGVCALRTGRRALAGAALATAALLRAFPIFLLAGLAIRIVTSVRARGLRQAYVEYRTLVAGFAMAAAVLLAFTTVTWRGGWGGPLEPWKAFASNSRKHLETPITNHIGLKPALWFSPDTRAAKLEDFWIDGPWDSWMAAHTATSQNRRPVYLAIAVIFVIGFWAAVRRANDWIALIASVALLPFATTLANYYYSVFLMLGFLWPLDKRIGVGLTALATLTAVIPALLEHRDDRYTVISIAVVLFAFFIVVRLRRLTHQPAPVPAVAEGVADPKAVM